MNEDEWLISDHPYAMIRELRQHEYSDRKFRLFACAIVRKSWHLLTDARSQRAVRIAELYADRLALFVDMVDFRSQASYAHHAACGHEKIIAAYDAYACCFKDENDAVDAVLEAPNVITRQCQADLLREIVGNPFREYESVQYNSTIVNLAQDVYDSFDPIKISILADALEDVGSELVEHLRSGILHVKGCWAIDSILGKS